MQKGEDKQINRLNLRKEGNWKSKIKPSWTEPFAMGILLLYYLINWMYRYGIMP
jgi:hypothetical protein